MADELSTLIRAVRGSRLLRALLIGFLILLLQIPILMIVRLIGERTERKTEAVEEVTGKWGRQQSVVGPALVVPYVARWTEGDAKTGQAVARAELRHATFLPESLEIEGRAASELRYRGIFGVPVYRLTLEMKGRFGPPDFSDWGIAAEEIQWERAELWIRISDARAIQNAASVTWNGSEIPFAPGLGNFAGSGSGIHVPIRGPWTGGTHEFACSLALNGSERIFFAPMGRDTSVRLRSDWPSPSFQGNWLPTDRSIGPDGFEATWNLSSLGRNYPQRWQSKNDQTKEIEKSEFGVDLFSSIDVYRLTERSVKYEALFLLLTFLTLWLFEVVSGRTIHSLQYLLVGAAMCLFYLLLLSISEHTGFLIAYLLASGGVVVLVTAYSAAVLGAARRAAILGAIVAALYVYLYILLNNEDFALLVGSVGLFMILAIVMYLTRKTDWSRA